MHDETAPAPFEERRRFPRTKLDVATRVCLFGPLAHRMPSRRSTSLLDLSLHGTALRGVPDLPEGAIVRLYVPAVGWRHVERCWHRDGVTGCRFLLPLTQSELGTAIEHAGSHHTIYGPADAYSRPSGRAWRTGFQELRRWLTLFTSAAGRWALPTYCPQPNPR